MGSAKQWGQSYTFDKKLNYVKSVALTPMGFSLDTNAVSGTNYEYKLSETSKVIA